MPYYYPPDTLSTVTSEQIDDRIAALLQEGEMIDLVYDDYANTLTINLDIPKGDIRDTPEQDFLAAVYNNNTDLHEAVRLRDLDVFATDVTSALSGTPVAVTVNWDMTRTSNIILTGGTGNLSVTFTNLRKGRKLTMFIKKSGGATVSAVTWPSSVKTDSGTALAITAGNVGDWYEFECFSDTVVVGVRKSGNISGM